MRWHLYPTTMLTDFVRSNKFILYLKVSLLFNHKSFPQCGNTITTSVTHLCVCTERLFLCLGLSSVFERVYMFNLNAV